MMVNDYQGTRGLDVEMQLEFPSHRHIVEGCRRSIETTPVSAPSASVITVGHLANDTMIVTIWVVVGGPADVAEPKLTRFPYCLW